MTRSRWAASTKEVVLVLSYAPATDQGRRYFEQAAPRFTLIPQQGASFGERLTGTFTRLLQSHSPVVVIGSDSPDLPAAVIERAFALLRDPVDAVIGPAKTWLLPARPTRVQPALFERIDWSTALCWCNEAARPTRI